MFSAKAISVFVVVTLWVVCLLWIPAYGSDLSKSELYAVIVGVKKFQDPNIPPLTISDKDAKDFYHFLKESEEHFAKAHITLLLNEDATRANVSKALRDGLMGARRNDIVIMYFSGHGMADEKLPNEFYFVTYDTQLENLFATALMMNDKNLFKGIDTDRVLLVADACHSGGFSPGIQKSISKETDRFFSVFNSVSGRVGILSSRPEEESYEKPKFGNSIFTHYMLKGLRGEAAKGSQQSTISAKDLYDYVYDQTKKATKGLQHPQFYATKGSEQTPVFVAPTFSQDLKVKVTFYYEDQSRQVKPLTEGARLKSGQHVGITFVPESDCYVYILWWDSRGAVGRLFPNPQLTEGTGEVKAGMTYWLPSSGGERWYVLDDNPGEETIYFLASRTRNPRIEQLYETLSRSPGGPTAAQEVKEISGELERQMNLMGFADFTVPKERASVSFASKEALVQSIQVEAKVRRTDAIVKLGFQHVAR
ncbi:MAG: caspase family protein [Desulfomonile tiedjei]|uniref:Caspase family protein n=1 Tax=Desulfomonile tiedjei TaxID=2358 RepID=A0A9D6V418_9BACT|nr:caspase family protein [Desulfomonile tiedjei]